MSDGPVTPQQDKRKQFPAALWRAQPDGGGVSIALAKFEYEAIAGDRLGKKEKAGVKRRERALFVLVLISYAN